MPHVFDRVPSDESLPARADVVVVGAGVIGVAAALELARAGLTVAVVDKGFVAAEQSSRNWGWVRQQGRDRREIPLIVESLRRWDRLQEESPIDLGFRRAGLVSLTRSQDELDRWRRWAERGRAGGILVEELSPAEAEQAFPSRGRPWIGGLSTPTDGKAEPSIAVPAIARLARSAGVTIHQETAVRGLDVSAGRIQGVVTERGRIAASRVLVAVGAWSSQLLRRHGVRLPQLIPVRLIIDACPTSMADGLDSFGIVNEETPSFDASLDDFVVGVPDEGAELVFAQVFPHVFHWIEFWAIGRQGKKRDIVRYDQRAAPLTPSRAITK